MLLVRRRRTLSFPVEIELVMADGTRRLEHWDGEGDSKRFAWHDAVAVRSAVVDPHDRVLIDQNLANNRASSAGHAGAGSPDTPSG